jgi:hypothetical protein
MSPDPSLYFEIRLSEKIDFMSIIFDTLGYRVRFVEYGNADSSVFEVDFGKSPLAERSMYEGKFLSLSWETESDANTGSIVLVKNSEFLTWFQTESSGLYLIDDVKHVAILTQDEWVEVLCLNLPTVRILENVELI